MSGRDCPARLRWARPADSPLLSALYRAAYASADGRPAAENYPHPHVLDPAWVAEALSTGRVLWRIAAVGGTVYGAVAAAPTHDEDAVAEIFGLVVDRRWRGRGLAIPLLRDVCALVGKEFHFAFGEVRTAEPQASRVVARSPLRPLGFEPFVHTMLAGCESMIAVGAVSREAQSRRARRGATTPSVGRLAARVLGRLGLEALPARCAKDGPCRYGGSAGAGTRVREIPVAESRAQARRADIASSEPLGVCSVHRMETLAGRGERLRQRAFALERGGAEVACAQLLEDTWDRRSRLTGLSTTEPGAEGPLLEALVQVLEREADGAPWVVVAEVDTLDVRVQQGLERLGFRPTGYYPALAWRRGERLDVVQLSRITGRAVPESLEGLGALRWPEAHQLARSVVDGFAGAIRP